MHVKRIQLIASFDGHVRYLIAASMASGQRRKRGKGDRRSRKRLKIAYDNVDCETDSACASSWTPKNWRGQYNNIKKMRENFDAPVDTVGASKLADPSALPEVRKSLFCKFQGEFLTCELLVGDLFLILCFLL